MASRSTPANPTADEPGLKQTTISLPAELLAQVDALAKERMLARNKLVELLLLDSIPRLVPISQMNLFQPAPAAPTTPPDPPS